MTLIEIFVVYLAIGAPFGAHHFLRRRAAVDSMTLWINSIGAALGWVIYAASLLYQRLSLRQAINDRFTSQLVQEKSVEIINQNLQTAFAELLIGNQQFSFFELRETLERYIGLTLAVRDSSFNLSAPKFQNEIFRIAGREKRDLQLAVQCLQRKNFLRLQNHQAHARQDLFAIIKNLNQIFGSRKNSSAAWQKVETNALLLAELLEDAQALTILQSLFELSQNNPEAIVFDATDREEKEKWNLQPIATSFRTWQLRTTNPPLRIKQD